MCLKRSSAGAVQAVCNGPSMSAAQCTTVRDGLLHPHLRYCLLAASAIRWLFVTTAFHVRSSTSGLFCGRPGGLELVTRLPARSAKFLWQFSPGSKNLSRFTSVHSTLEALRLCASLYKSAIDIDIDKGMRLSTLGVLYKCCYIGVRVHTYRL